MYFSVSSVQSLSCLRLFATPWIKAHQVSLSITNSWHSLKRMSIESVMPSSHLILCRPLLLLPPIAPSIRVFSNEVNSLHEVAKVLEFQLQHQFLPMNTQDWSPLGCSGWISLQVLLHTIKNPQIFPTDKKLNWKDHFQIKMEPHNGITFLIFW